MNNYEYQLKFASNYICFYGSLTLITRSLGFLFLKQNKQTKTLKNWLIETTNTLTVAEEENDTRMRVKKMKRNKVSNSVITLRSDRWFLSVVRAHCEIQRAFHSYNRVSSSGKVQTLDYLGRHILRWFRGQAGRNCEWRGQNLDKKGGVEAVKARVPPFCPTRKDPLHSCQSLQVLSVAR